MFADRAALLTKRHELLGARAGRIAFATLAGIALVVAIGIAALWPGENAAGARPTTVGGVEAATVLAVETGPACASFESEGCQVVKFEVTSGTRFKGERASLVLSGRDAAPTIEPGDAIRVARLYTGDVVPQTPFGQDRVYTFIDFERRSPLLLFALAFVVLVLVLGRGHGLRALLGLAGSIVVLMLFIVPAIYAGRSPLLVAIVGALAVMLLTIGISHGLGIKSAAAMLGTTASLLVTVLLALLAVGVVHLTGTSVGEASILRGSREFDSFEGLVLAGIVIGALGVLDDVTVSQASTVLALHRTDPTLRLRQLVLRALEVGRDHLGATVNTLALAYAGAALPLLLVFQARDATVGDVLNREPVATALAAAIVGSIGLILAVPLTTVVAALLARAVPPEELPNEHAHRH